MQNLTIYCPHNKRLVKELVKQGYNKYIVSFDHNPFFKDFAVKVLRHLSRLKRRDLIEECMRFWYLFLLKQHAPFISDYNYYGHILSYFMSKRIFKYDPIWRSIKIKKKYVCLVYKNDKFYFIETFSSLAEMEDFFQIRVKIEKRDYTIKYR